MKIINEIIRAERNYFKVRTLENLHIIPLIYFVIFFVVTEKTSFQKKVEKIPASLLL